MCQISGALLLHAGRCCENFGCCAHLVLFWVESGVRVGGRQFNRFNSLQGVNGFWKWMLDRLKHKDGSSVLIHHDREHPTAADFCAAFGGSKRPPVVLFIDEASALAGKVQCFQTSISVMQHAVHTIC